VSISSQPPIRLICAQCSRPLPVKPPPPPYLWWTRNTRRWLLLLVLLLPPLLLLSLPQPRKANIERGDRPRLGRLTSGRVFHAKPGQASRATHPSTHR
jgi:hypothetical protein